MSRRMSTTRFRRQETMNVSLFPFLAVLICTMGALILLLVVIARQSRLRAEETLIVETTEIEQQIQHQREAVRLRIDALKTARNETDQQLITSRLELGNIEDHQRQLREQFRHLSESLAQLDLHEIEGNSQREQIEKEIARLKELSAESAQVLAETEKKNGNARESYAVIPYEGTHQTHRRPIYLECRADGLALQPEGLMLEESDFVGPMGPGNPLDAALRAVREYLLNRGILNTAHDAAEPYPLLLVRPSGIETYYLARKAMQSWGSEFGYELIGEDWSLEFQPPDPSLAVVLGQVLEIARQRQTRLIAAAPSVYGSQGPRYRSDPNRGNRLSVESVPEKPQNRPFDQSTGGAIASDESNSPRAAALSKSPVDAADYDETQQTENVSCLAKVRGRNWGLPDAAAGSIPITRPIHIDCFIDRLIVVPDTRSGGSDVIPMPEQTQQAIDQLVSTVWEVIETWGIAGNGMYWKPVINVYVASNAERRYQELALLLDRSGLELQRIESR